MMAGQDDEDRLAVRPSQAMPSMILPLHDPATRSAK
jgi:hypothetical protein